MSKADDNKANTYETGNLMTQYLPPYPAYKDSAIPWLGRIPAHWEVVPGRACFREKKIPNTGMQETTVLSLSYGKLIIKSPDKLHGLVPASFETYQIVEPNDIICRPTDLQNDWNSLRFGISRHRGIITSAYMNLNTLSAMFPEYGYLVLHAYDLKKIFYGLGSGLRQNLDWRDFKYLPCVLPPLPEQRLIARYLDWADGRIRRLIRTRQRQIKLLEVYKQALIHQAVTGQIDVRTGKPYPAYKDSGVDWLGKVPAHWEVVPLKRIGSVRIGLIYSPSDVCDENGTLILRASNIRNGKLIHADNVYVSVEIPKNLLVSENDILVCVRSGSRILVGKSALITKEFEGVSYGAFMSLLRTIDNRFYYFVLNSNLLPTVMAQFETSTINQLTQNDLRSLMVPVPPATERSAILRFLEANIETIDAAIAATRRSIDLLREYRTRLIADVVTGKVDVREVAARLPEEVEEILPEETEEAGEEGIDVGDEEICEEN